MNLNSGLQESSTLKELLPFNQLDHSSCNASKSFIPESNINHYKQEANFVQISSGEIICSNNSNLSKDENKGVGSIIIKDLDEETMSRELYKQEANFFQISSGEIICSNNSNLSKDENKRVGSIIIKDLDEETMSRELYKEGMKLAKNLKNLEAIEKFEEAMKLDPKNYKACTNCAKCLEKVKKFEESIKYCEEAIKINPKSARAYSYWGTVLSRLGRCEEAIGKFETAILHERRDANFIYMSWGITLTKLEKYEEALEKFQQAIQQNKKGEQDFTLHEVYLRIGDVYRKLGKYDKAEKNYKRANELIYDKIEGNQRLQRYYGRAVGRLGFVYLLKKDAELASVLANAALNQYPKLIFPYLVHGMALAQKDDKNGECEMYKKGVLEAKEDIDEEKVKDLLEEIDYASKKYEELKDDNWKWLRDKLKFIFDNFIKENTG